MLRGGGALESIVAVPGDGQASRVLGGGKDARKTTGRLRGRIDFGSLIRLQPDIFFYRFVLQQIDSCGRKMWIR